MDPGHVWWFSVQLDSAALSEWFRKGPAVLQGRIAALEALAQLVLLKHQRELVQAGGATQWIALRQRCDVAGVVAPARAVIEATAGRGVAVYGAASCPTQN